MLKIGIVAEGLPNSDVKIISELVKKILNNNPFFVLRPGGSKSNVIEKYRGWLEEFRHKRVEKALIIVDQDMACVKILVEKMQNKIVGENIDFQ
jgi:hypothetical protein